MKIKLFYGWYIVAAGMVLATYYSAIFSYGWTAFIGPIATTFGWSMAQVSLASSLRSLETGVFNPLWGPAVDRWSSRKLMLFGVICSALGMFLLSQMKNLAMLYAGFFIGGVGSSLIAGMLPQTVMARWFRRDLGKASGLFYMSTVGGGVLVPVIVKILDRIGWQSTLLYASIGFLVLGIPLSFVTRSRPQDYGLLPDGKPLDATSGSRPAILYDFGTSAKEVFKMRAFWYLGVGYLWEFSVFSTVALYAVPYLTSLGIERSTASMVVSLYTLVAAVGRVLIGTLSDFFRKSYMMALSCGLMEVGLFIFWRIGGTSHLWLILLFGIIYGLGLSGLSPLRAPIIAEYFGTRKFGTIFGLTSIFTSLAQVASQPLAGLIYDTHHDYKVWWLALIAFGLVALTAILAMPRATERSRVREAHAGVSK